MFICFFFQFGNYFRAVKITADPDDKILRAKPFMMKYRQIAVRDGGDGIGRGIAVLKKVFALNRFSEVPTFSFLQASPA